MTDHQAMSALSNAIPVLGITLLCCLLIGKLSKKLGVPKVSGYIILGILLGPGAANFITHEFTISFSFFNDLALGLILFNIGGEFNQHLIAKLNKQQILYSLLSSCLVILFTGLLYFGLSMAFIDMNMSTRIIISLFLAVVAVEAAPPTSMLVLKEYNANGILSTSIKVYLAFATIVAVSASIILSKAFEYFAIWQSADSGRELLFLQATWSILASSVFGIILGVALSYFETWEKKIGNILFAVIGTILFGQSLAHYLQFDSLLISLFLGFTLSNASSAGEKIHVTAKDISGSIYALFFVFAGTHINVEKLVYGVGAFGLIYIGARVIGIILASKIACYFLKIQNENFKKYHGLGVISHAGAALAIVSRVQNFSEESAQLIFNIVVSSIFVFEILGPLLLKFALYKSGEISSWNPTVDKTSKLKLNLKEILENFKNNLNPTEVKQVLESKYNIEDLIKTDIVAIKSDANLESIKSFIDDDHALYPVVDEDHCYLGTLNTSSIKKILQHPDDPLVTASALIGESTFIPSNVTIDAARNIFSMSQKDVLPVVDPVDRTLLGVIFQKDVLVSLSKDQKGFVDRPEIG